MKSSIYTKKEIKRILRSLNKTEIFKMYVKINGSLDRYGLYNFIQDHAPSKRVANMAYEIAYGCSNKVYSSSDLMTRKQKIVEYLKEQIKDVTSPYAKKPMLGHTKLYFCSPNYGHKDYNKYSALRIKGNERFCELIVKLGDKYFK